MISAQKTIYALFAGLSPRQQEVIEARFGVNKKKEAETLAAIGERMDITRERVRQIEKSALDFMKTRVSGAKDIPEIVSGLVKHVKNSGGVVKKENLLKHAEGFVNGLDENHIQLLIETSEAFSAHQEDDDFWMFYYAGKKDFDAAKNFIHEWVSFVRNKKHEILAGNYKKYLDEFSRSKNVSKLETDNFLGISKKIRTSPYGDIGLTEWAEIRPRTTRDRVYLVLKKKKEPLHFEKIADAINTARLSVQLALAPTVHNELIKDPRFVLVGRGTYGLAEHGYEPGVAREVIHRILKRHSSLSPDEIVVKVNEQRLFKPNTIFINLQNKTLFERLPNGNYRVREA